MCAENPGLLEGTGDSLGLARSGTARAGARTLERGRGSVVEQVLARLVRDGPHLLDQGVELPSVGDPLLVEASVFRRESSRDGLASLLPGQLIVRPVAVVGVGGAAAVGFAARGPTFDEASLTDEADVVDPLLDAVVLALTRAQSSLERLGGEFSRHI